MFLYKIKSIFRTISRFCLGGASLHKFRTCYNLDLSGYFYGKRRFDHRFSEGEFVKITLFENVYGEVTNILFFRNVFGNRGRFEYRIKFKNGLNKDCWFSEKLLIKWSQKSYERNLIIEKLLN